MNSLRFIIDVTIDKDIPENITDKEELIAQMSGLHCEIDGATVQDQYLSYMMLVDKDGNEIEEWML